MTNDISALDAFLAGPYERDLTRTLRALLYTASYRECVVVFGPSLAVERVLSVMVRTFPRTDVHIGLVEEQGKRVHMGPPFAEVGHEVPEGTIALCVRSLLRQDPDVVATTSVDEEGASIVLQAALTGHQIVVGIAESTAQAAQTFLMRSMSNFPNPDDVLPIGVAVEVEEVQGAPRIVAVYCRHEGALCECVSVRGGEVKVVRDYIKVPALATGPRYTPTFTPPVTERAPATAAPRAAYLPVTKAEAPSRSCISGATALLSRGESWPVCQQCKNPLALVVQLDGQALPEPMRFEGLAQLFVCSHGCAAEVEGLSVRTFMHANPEALEVVTAPSGVHVSPLAGAITDWVAYTESPLSEDIEYFATKGPQASEATPLSLVEVEKAPPLACDKLGGYPAWQQGPAWPADEDGTPMQLLFQFQEGVMYEGGTTAGWDWDTATMVPATPGTPVLDPNLPQHFGDLLTAEATGFLFINADKTKLAFVWQTG